MRWNILAYYLVWYSVAKFSNSYYLIAAYLILIGYLFFHFKFLVQDKTSEIKLVILVTFLGLSFDSINNLLFHFSWDRYYLTWLTPIWIMFALTLNHSLKFIFNNRIFLISFSAIGGPWAYWVASKLIPFSYNLNVNELIGHGILWVIFMFIINFIRGKHAK